MEIDGPWRKFFIQYLDENLYMNGSSRANEACPAGHSGALVDECNLIQGNGLSGEIENGLFKLKEEMERLRSQTASIIQPASLAVSILQELNSSSNKVIFFIFNSHIFLFILNLP